MLTSEVDVALPGLSYENQEWRRGGFPKENREMAIRQVRASDVGSSVCVGAFAPLPPGAGVILIGCVFPLDP